MRAQGKPAKVAIVAIARKLLILANALVRDRVAYQKASMATRLPIQSPGWPPASGDVTVSPFEQTSFQAILPP